MADIILGIAVIIGLVGTLVPAFPGTAVILLGAAIHAFLTDFHPITVNSLLLLSSLFVAGWVGQYAVTGLGTKRFGASKYGVLGACLGMIVGLMIPVVGGIFIGTFLGAFIFEMIFAVKKAKDGVKAGFGAVIGTVFSLFYEFFVAVGMVVVLAWLLFQ